jgi:segregation and condensation protein A
MLELPARERVDRPNPPPRWRVPDALAHRRARLAGQPQGATLASFLLVIVGQGPVARLQRRAALASTLVAGLEHSRGSAVVLNQGAAFGEIVVRPGVAPSVTAAQDAAA